MKKTAALILCLAPFVAGCTDADWNRLVNYGGEEEEVVTPVTSAPPPATVAAEPAGPANADFCKGVASQDATTNGFDQATQARVFQRSYAQCVAIYTR